MEMIWYLVGYIVIALITNVVLNASKRADEVKTRGVVIISIFWLVFLCFLIVVLPFYLTEVIGRSIREVRKQK